jgi:hypothetical protein
VKARRMEFIESKKRDSDELQIIAPPLSPNWNEIERKMARAAMGAKE